MAGSSEPGQALRVLRAPGRLLVTGATGFVGRVLVAQALRSGWSVAAAVRGGEVTLPAGVRVHALGDFTGSVDWEGALVGVDVVIHLAGRVHRMADGAIDALAAYRLLNVTATVALAEAAARAGVGRFVHISSTKVLGESTPIDHPFDAQALPAPASAYGVSKLEAEQALMALDTAGYLEVVVVRPPLVHGPGASGNLRRLARWIAAGVPLPLAGVDNLRSLVGVQNLADALLHLAHHPQARGHRFLVADTADLSTPQLCRLLGEAVGRPARLFALPDAILGACSRLDGSGTLARLTESLRVDASELTRVTGWRPPRTVAQGLGLS